NAASRAGIWRGFALMQSSRLTLLRAASDRPASWQPPASLQPARRWGRGQIDPCRLGTFHLESRQGAGKRVGRLAPSYPTSRRAVCPTRLVPPVAAWPLLRAVERERQRARAQVSLELLRRQRPGKEIPLRLGAALVEQEGRLRAGLDPLGDDLEP